MEEVAMEYLNVLLRYSSRNTEQIHEISPSLFSVLHATDTID